MPKENKIIYMPHLNKKGKVTVFFNPFDIVIQAYQELYTNACQIAFVMDLAVEGSLGCTVFDPEFKKAPQVQISFDCSIKDSVGILMHELAHVATGVSCIKEGLSEQEEDKAAHDKHWKAAYSSINKRYTKLVTAKAKSGIKKGTSAYVTVA